MPVHMYVHVLFLILPQVFKVWNAVQSRMEALSVMDCDVIAETESQEVVSVRATMISD